MKLDDVHTFREKKSVDVCNFREMKIYDALIFREMKSDDVHGLRKALTTQYQFIQHLMKKRKFR